mmetsp:Transcript_36304/g.50430  ORF Transcript_36304/g.50430 Transcript_36304/m.50430 type:complete len:265 (-) Transcript_36304:203-997(-)|eukprot:CAMPEP_0196593420 /NCGR_PEP_ID=MMETSP1081-20130531/75580_1 /TAXON_ID=36882 /ORGANISM="Pyramimonas amylifera, Strain CCMP720" /LENGTH=264 /DNA_ID=CAMNT_0041917403 /DNA_START=322 /DNA_END=1116 /DNA_ORIENTATION=-
MANNGEPIKLNVYNLGSSESIHKINAVTYELGGGLYHTAIEVFGKEFSFGYCESGSGVFDCIPQQCELHQFMTSILLGHTSLSKEAIRLVVKQLEFDYPGTSYDLLNRNCHTFSQEFAHQLGVDDLPGWITRFPAIGSTTVKLAKVAYDQAKAVDKQLDLTKKVNQILASEVGIKVISGVGVAFNSAGQMGVALAESTSQFEAKHELKNKAIAMSNSGIGLLSIVMQRVGSAASSFRQNMENKVDKIDDSSNKMKGNDKNSSAD